MDRNRLALVVLAVFATLAGLALSGALLAGEVGRVPILRALQPQRALALSATVNPRPLAPTGSGFTYQGRLANSGSPANGQYDILFTLYDAPTAGNQVGTPSIVTDTNQTVTDGLFTVSLDFGPSAFDGNARYLELAVRQSGVGSFTTLSPRQPLSPAPYALFALKTQGYKGVKVVAQSGGDFTSVQSALNSITDNSTNNRYLLKIAAGTYTETIIMKPFVDIEGSGEDVTKITFGGSASLNTGTVLGASNAELRSLTVESSGGMTDSVAIFNNLASPSLLHVTANAFGSTVTNAVNLGIYNTSFSSPTMKDVSATGTGGTSAEGIRNNVSSSPNMTDVTATASGGTSSLGIDNISSSPTMNLVVALGSGGTTNYGMLNTTSAPKIQNSSFTGTGTTSYGIYNAPGLNNSTILIENSVITGATNSIRSESHYTMRVGGSQLAGGPVLPNSGPMTCGDTHDGNNALIPNNCVNQSGNVVNVAKAGAAFTSIQAALNSITDNSTTNRYLVKVGPGTYNETVTMKQYVDIEGSGEDTTKITATGSVSNTTGTVIGASNAELRLLSVENTGGNVDAIAIYDNGASPSLLHVTVTASSATTNTWGIYNSSSSASMTDVTVTASGGYTVYGISNSQSSPTMTDVTVTATTSTGRYCYGVGNTNSSSPTMTHVTATASDGSTYTYGVSNTQASSPKMTDVEASAVGGGGLDSYGVYNDASTPDMFNVIANASDADGQNYGVYNNDSSPTMINVTANASGGAFNNFGVNNYGNSSPTMTGVTATASGGTDTFGVANGYGSTSPKMTNVTATGTGGTDENIGVYNETDTPTLTNVTANATGPAGRSNNGVLNEGGAPQIRNSVLSASGGAASYGIHNFDFGGAPLIRVDNCVVSGSTNSILNDTSFIVRVGGSKLSGSVNANGGTVTCAGVYNSAYTFFPSTCP